MRALIDRRAYQSTVRSGRRRLPGQDARPRARYRSVHRWSRTFAALQWMWMVLAALGVIASLVIVGVVLSSSTPSKAAVEIVTAVEIARALILPVLFAVGWTVLAVFVIWLWRSTRNQWALGARRLRLSPGAVVVSSFVPILNLWSVQVALNDLWRTSDPSVAVSPGDSWRRRRVRGAVRRWWLVAASVQLASAGVGALIGLQLNTPDPTVGQVLGGEMAWATLLVVGFIAARFTRSIVRQITNRQIERATRVAFTMRPKAPSWLS